MILNPPFENRAGVMYIEGVSSLDLAGDYGTPVYVYSESRIRENYKRLSDAVRKHYPQHRLLYACKANTNLCLLRLFRELGAEIDAVSPGEVYLALHAGFKPGQILFTGTSVGEEEMSYLIDAGVRLNIDSISQMDKMLTSSVPEMVSVRVNPEVGAGHHEHVITAGPDVKFGVWEAQAWEAYRLAKVGGVKRFGIQMHIGSGISDVEKYVLAVTRLLEIAAHIQSRVGLSFDFIDIGGGIGVPYKPSDVDVDLDAFMDRLFGVIKEKLVEHSLGSPEIWLEPGRYLIAESGIVLTRVTTLKSAPGKNFIGVDAGFNTLVRPAMYGSYHHILAANRLNEPKKVYDVYGPLCESGDIFARDREVAKVDEGDLLAIMNAGAYGYSMSSNYNSRPRPAEVLVHDGAHRLIRESEKMIDLIWGQF